MCTHQTRIFDLLSNHDIDRNSKRCRHDSTSSEDVAFHQEHGLRIEEMVKSTRVDRQLGNFRAGMKVGISGLTGLGTGTLLLESFFCFRAFVWSCVVAHRSDKSRNLRYALV